MIYLIALLTIALDQLSKFCAEEYLVFHRAVEVMPFFNLFLTYNKGVSFSFFSMNEAYGPWVLSGLSLIICCGLIVWLRKEKNKVNQIGIALILGGALGNVLDRIRIGAVVDFLDFYYGAYHWPAFNVADTAICFGAFLIFLQLILTKDEK